MKSNERNRVKMLKAFYTSVYDNSRKDLPPKHKPQKPEKDANQTTDLYKLEKIVQKF
jgi:hypothetical protein